MVGARDNGKFIQMRSVNLPGDKRGALCLSCRMIWKFRPLAGSLAFVCLCASAAADATPLTPEEMTGAARTDGLSVPMPGEFMAAVNKLGKIDWLSKVRLPVGTSYTSRAQMALNLGGLIADGYVAIEAQDSMQVKNVGRDVLTLATNLGVGKELKERAGSIAAFAESGHWDQLKEELEATQNEVKLAMASAKDQDLVTLVTVGGWLRGVEVISGQIGAHYTELGGKLLRQPGVVAFLMERLDRLPDKIKDDSSVKTVHKKMGEIEKFVAFPLDKAPTVDDVKTLNKLAADTLKEISKKQK
jgi:hypothetical protein